MTVRHIIQCRDQPGFVAPLLTDLPLSFTLQVLGLPLQLLAVVAGQPADRVANPALDLLRRALDLLLGAFIPEFVSHCSFRLIGIQRRAMAIPG